MHVSQIQKNINDSNSYLALQAYAEGKQILGSSRKFGFCFLLSPCVIVSVYTSLKAKFLCCVFKNVGTWQHIIWHIVTEFSKRFATTVSNVENLSSFGPFEL